MFWHTTIKFPRLRVLTIKSHNSEVAVQPFLGKHPNLKELKLVGKVTSDQTKKILLNNATIERLHLPNHFMKCETMDQQMPLKLRKLMLADAEYKYVCVYVCTSAFILFQFLLLKDRSFLCGSDE